MVSYGEWQLNRIIKAFKWANSGMGLVIVIVIASASISLDFLDAIKITFRFFDLSVFKLNF